MEFNDFLSMAMGLIGKKQGQPNAAAPPADASAPSMGANPSGSGFAIRSPDWQAPQVFGSRGGSRDNALEATRYDPGWDRRNTGEAAYQPGQIQEKTLDTANPMAAMAGGQGLAPGILDFLRQRGILS